MLAIVLLGCEENLSARTHYDRPFTVYGVLSPELARQSVRVYAIEDFPTLGSESIDAVVTSKDLTTGETHAWRDSVSIDPNGQHEHIFWSPFRAEYGHTYRVEITRPSDGALSFAVATVPPEAFVEVDDSQSPDIYVTARGESIRVLSPEVVYVVQRPFPPPNDFYPILTYAILYAGQEQETAGGWRFHIRMHFDRDRIVSWYNHDAHTFNDSSHPCQLMLRDLRLDAVVGDSAWNPPGGVFDPKLLAHPGVMSNVRNGFGFVGAGYHMDESLKLSQEAVENACFYYYDPTR